MNMKDEGCAHLSMSISILGSLPANAVLNTALLYMAWLRDATRYQMPLRCAVHLTNLAGIIEFQGFPHPSWTLLSCQDTHEWQVSECFNLYIQLGVSPLWCRHSQYAWIHWTGTVVKCTSFAIIGRSNYAGLLVWCVSL